MGIQSASATITRFYMPDPVTEDFWSYVDEKLRTGSFKECEEGQEQSTGFASWDDFFDSGFTDGSYHKSEYVAFNFRVDQRKVPSIILKQHVRQAIQKYKQDHDGKWPSRQEKLDIHENMQSWLLNRVLPQPSHCEVVWNPVANWMMLGTTSTKTMEALLELFERQFNIYPVPLYHVHWALNLIPLDGRQKDVLGSMIPVKSQQALNEGRFLGYEFLTWLWFLSEKGGGRFQLPEKRTGEVALGERLVLSLPGDGKEKVICTTQANALHEARTALRQGKLVEEMQVHFRIGENDYSLNLDSSLWAIKGIKTPKQLPDYEEQDGDGKFLEKMFFLEEIFAALNAIYAQFLSHRLGPAWDSDILPAFKGWIVGNEQDIAPF
jgi:hypothetical protein